MGLVWALKVQVCHCGCNSHPLDAALEHCEVLFLDWTL